MLVLMLVPPVAALRAIALVAEPVHQPDPGVGDPLHVPARACGLVAEAIAGKRRTDDVEGVGRVASVGGRVSERPEHLQELDDRAWPAVRENKRQGVLVRRANVKEVDSEPVDPGAELRQSVEPILGGPPVVAVGPVGTELLQVTERHALRPVVDRLAFGPARARQTRTKIAELGVGNTNPKRRHLAGHRAADPPRPTPVSLTPSSRRAVHQAVRRIQRQRARGDSRRKIADAPNQARRSNSPRRQAVVRGDGAPRAAQNVVVCFP
jgi:hypothetical protein